jgi:hypothetical protein
MADHGEPAQLSHGVVHAAGQRRPVRVEPLAGDGNHGGGAHLLDTQFPLGPLLGGRGGPAGSATPSGVALPAQPPM